MSVTSSIKLKFFVLSQIALAILLLNRHHYSQDGAWIFVGTDERRTKAMYVDPNTRKSPAGNLFVWEKLIWSDASYLLGLVEWDCRQKRSRVIQQSLYDRYGELSELSKNFDWLYMVDETLGAAVYKVVCRAARTSPPSSSIETASEISLAEIIVSAASLRESASIKGSVIREVAKRERLILTDAEPRGNWHQVIDRDTQSKGWLHKSTFKVIKPSKSSPRRKSA